jgi:NADH-quinone oxidoreductase subunit C
MKEIYQSLVNKFANHKIEFSESPLFNFIIVPSDIIQDVCNYLKNERSFNYLSSLCGAEQKDCLEVIYHIGSIESKKMVVIKTRVPKDNPKVPTVENIFPSASLFERETFEMFGVEFEGHHDLRRLLLPDDWEGYPLRKDYKYPTEYHGILHDRGGSVDRTLKK